MKKLSLPLSPPSGAWGLLLTSILLLLNCTTKTSTENTPETTTATDSVITTANVVTEVSPEPEALEEETAAYQEEEQTLSTEDVYGDEGDDFQGDYEGDDLSRQDENGTVHFLNGYSENPYPVSMFDENKNPKADVPAYLNAKGIKYSLEKKDADPSNEASTDSEIYTFGESVIELNGNEVIYAMLYSPEIELQDGVQVGMTEDDFMARFPQIASYRGTENFELQTNTFNSHCTLTFEFGNGKIKSIKLDLSLQECR